MMTVKQVSSLTGVSIRTLQFYDGIGLLKPTRVTDAGYRLYDENALQILQQILFFKELDFTLREIKAIMENPQFDKAAAFEKQRELIQIKRDRLTGLLGLLDRLIKGENSMDFKEFDMEEYFRVLAEFKKTHTDDIIKQLGSMESFDQLEEELRANAGETAEQAEKQYGSLEAFTKAMEKNLHEFLKNGPMVPKAEVNGLIEKTDEVTRRLTARRGEDPASPEVQEIVAEMISFVNECNKGMDMGENYWSFMAGAYDSNPVNIEVTDKKYGEGASKFMGAAIKAYLDRTRTK